MYVVVCKTIKKDKFISVHRYTLRKDVNGKYEEIQLSFAVNNCPLKIVHIDGRVRDNITNRANIRRINYKRPPKHIKDLAEFLLRNPEARAIYEK